LTSRPPGLHLLVRSCNEQAVDLTQSGVLMAPVAQELVLVALKQGVVWARSGETVKETNNE